MFIPAVLLALSLGSPVAGVVLDPSGHPLPRVAIVVTAPGGAAVGVVFSDVEGRFRIPDAPEGCSLRTSLSGFAPATATCRTDGPVTLTMALAPVSESVVVSATRTDAPSSQVASAVTVFDADEIERRQEPQLADLLRFAAGTHVVRSGAPGSVTSLFIRGGESNYTKVLLDGIPLNEPGGVFNLGNLTTENLDRVELVRGANSAVYGSDAMTGVLQLFTRRGTTATPEGHAAIEAGSFGTGRGSAGVAGKTGALDYSADAAAYTTDNEVPNNAFRNFTLSGTAGAAVTDTAMLRFVGRLERGKTGVPGQTAFGPADMDAYSQRHDGTWGVSFDQTIGGVRQHASYGLAISHQVSTNLIADPSFTPAYGDSLGAFEFSDFTYDSRSDLRRHRASYQVDGTFETRSAGTHVDTALIDWDGERAELRDVMAGTTVPASRDNVGVTLQHQALWSRVFVTAGIRFEHNDSFGNEAVPRVSGSWFLHTGSGRIGTTRVTASAGTGIKEPTVIQSFSPSPYFQGNPDLQPERTRALDVGVEQRLADDRVRVNWTWFDNRYEDIISLRTDNTTFFSQYFNIGLTTARGMELSGDVALTSGFRAKAGYTFTDSEIVESTSDSEVFQPGNWAFRRPRHAGFVSVAWTGARASADLSGTLLGRRVDSDFVGLVPAILENQRYQLWDLRAAYRLTRMLSATFALDNLGDSDHMEPLGYPVLGRAARAGLRVRF